MTTTRAVPPRSRRSSTSWAVERPGRVGLDLGQVIDQRDRVPLGGAAETVAVRQPQLHRRLARPPSTPPARRSRRWPLRTSPPSSASGRGRRARPCRAGTVSTLWRTTSLPGVGGRRPVHGAQVVADDVFAQTVKGDRPLRRGVARRALQVAGDPRRQRMQRQHPGMHRDALRLAHPLHGAAQAERVGPRDLHRADLVHAPPRRRQPVGPQTLLARLAGAAAGPGSGVSPRRCSMASGAQRRRDRLVTWTTAMAGVPFSTRGGSTARSRASRGRRQTWTSEPSDQDQHPGTEDDQGRPPGRPAAAASAAPEQRPCRCRTGSPDEPLVGPLRALNAAGCGGPEPPGGPGR